MLPENISISHYRRGSCQMTWGKWPGYTLELDTYENPACIKYLYRILKILNAEPSETFKYYL